MAELEVVARRLADDLAAQVPDVIVTEHHRQQIAEQIASWILLLNAGASPEAVLEMWMADNAH